MARILPPSSFSFSTKQESREGGKVHAQHNSLPSNEDTGPFALQSTAGLSQIPLTLPLSYASNCGSHLPENPHHALLSGSAIVGSVAFRLQSLYTWVSRGDMYDTCRKSRGRVLSPWNSPPNSAKLALWS